MNENRGLRYLLGFGVIIFLLIFLIIWIFNSGGSGSKTKVPATAKTLESYASTDATVKLTIDGPVTADQNHTAVSVTVSRDQTSYQVTKGYEGQVVSSGSYANNETSYDTFLRSLNQAGFTKGSVKDMNADLRGYCPLGRRYLIELNDGNKDVIRYWTTSCGKPKTFNGDMGLVLQLFRNQLPDYNSVSNQSSSLL